MVRKSDAAQRLESAPLLIRRIDAIPVSVPLVQAVLMGGGQKFTRSESLVVRAEAANGLVGWGEASAAPTMTGDSLEGMVAAVERYFAPLLIGHDALDLGVLARMKHYAREVQSEDFVRGSIQVVESGEGRQHPYRCAAVKRPQG